VRDGDGDPRSLGLSKGTLDNGSIPRDNAWWGPLVELLTDVIFPSGR